MGFVDDVYDEKYKWKWGQMIINLRIFLDVDVHIILDSKR